MRGDVGRVDVAVAGVGGHVEGVAGDERRGRGVVAAAPQHELLVAELLLDLGLVLPLQVPVVALVEAPVPAHGEPAAAGGGQGELGRADGPGEHRGVQDAQVQALARRPGAPAGGGLGLAGGGEVDVDPAREQVLGVPGGLAVAEQDQIEHACSVGGPAEWCNPPGQRGGNRGGNHSLKNLDKRGLNFATLVNSKWRRDQANQ